jgi:hypothetical protein
MHDETTMVSNLVKALDDTGLFYADASIHVTKPWVKRALARLVRTHQSIADELCTHVKMTGGGSIPRDNRDGRRGRTWRTSWSGWMARNHFDTDLAYAQQAKRHEDRLSRRFARAMRRTPEDAFIRWRLESCLDEIDHARTSITRVVAAVEKEIDARWLDERTADLAPAVARSPQPVERERGHFGA